MVHQQSQVLEALAALKEVGTLRPLDYQFARLIESLGGEPETVLAAALVSHELASGNVCLPLGDNVHRDYSRPEFEVLKPFSALIEPAHLNKRLTESRLVSDGLATPTPLVLSQKRVYLYRYWQFEQQVANDLNRKQALTVNVDAVKTILDRLFAPNYAVLFKQLRIQKDDSTIQSTLIHWLDIVQSDHLDWQAITSLVRQAQSDKDLEALGTLIPQHHCLNWQKVAAALAATQSFCVISGGPGTGKTTTVTRLLAMLVELGFREHEKAPLIRLVAPTGKASARLTESIGGALQTLNCDERIRSSIPEEAGTLHRLLGVIPDSNDFRHHRDNPLHLDILVVDEASMIDLPMMNRLLDALPDHARLILLGDRDQLASVEAGSVLGDICSAAGEAFSEAEQRRLSHLTGYDLSGDLPKSSAPIHNRFCLLRKSYRFGATSGIGCLATTVNEGNLKSAKAVWTRGFQDIQRHIPDDRGYPLLLSLCVDQYRPYLEALAESSSPEDILNRFNRFRLLCAVREGRYGVDGLNDAIRHALARENLIEPDTLWYPGRPVMVTRNDHGLGLYNGDIGITMPDANNRLRVLFQLPDGTLKALLPSRLPQHETVYAMTIHKSQGSEFEHTAMILPDTMSPVLTRELVYTGITRAKSRLDLFANDSVFYQAITKPTLRASGLEERLLSFKQPGLMRMPAEAGR